MIEYTTREEFRYFSSNLNFFEQASVRKRAEERSPTGTTFLSHATADGELVVGAIRVLEEHGATVYVDKKDISLPPYTSEETARILKRRIETCRRFVLLASENSKASSWVPWELGLADAKKGLDGVALFPAVEDRRDTAWTKSEYMGLYRRIVYGDLEGCDKKVWMVLDHKESSATQLSRWLAGW